MQRKRIYQILAAGTVCATLAGTAVYAGNQPLKVNVQEISTGGITQTIEAEGHIESEEEQTYYARVTAPIASFDASEGDLVHKGELLVTYDTEDLDRNVEQAKIQAAALASGYRGSAAQAEELQKAYSDAAMQDAVYQEAYQAALTNVNDLKYNIEVVADAVNDKNKALQIEIADLQVQIAAKNAAAKRWGLWDFPRTCTSFRRRCPAASSSGLPSRGRSQKIPDCCSATSRQGRSTPTRGAMCLNFWWT